MSKSTDNIRSGFSMEIVTDSKGIIDTLHPAQGTGDAAQAGFKSVVLDV